MLTHFNLTESQTGYRMHNKKTKCPTKLAHCQIFRPAQLRKLFQPMDVNSTTIIKEYHNIFLYNNGSS